MVNLCYNKIMILKGVVKNIVFYNNQNGYCVLILSADDGDEYTCVGNMPVVSVGEELELEGKVVCHPKFGEQFSVQKIIVSAPNQSGDIKKYLASGLIRGVGPKTAEAIVAAFGDKSMDVLRDNPMELVKIRGISKNKAVAIGNAFAEHIDMQQQIMFLQSYNITTNMAVKIYNAYKGNVQRVLTKNPYKLIDDIDGIGFATADKIAQSMGIASDSEFRIRAGVVYYLKESAEKLGNTFLYTKDLNDALKELLGLENDIDRTVMDGIYQNLQFDLVCNCFNYNGESCIALTKYFKQEKAIAAQIVKLVREIKPLGINTDAIIDEFERVNKIKFHPSQREAINSAVNGGVTIVTGGPGTGKTTIIKCVSYIFNSLKLKVEYCTPTGRAAKRLSESTGQEAKTIHRMLGMEFNDGAVRFCYNKSNRLPADVIIIDELSMADVGITFSLTNAIKDNCRLVLVGDKDQLPSVGAGNVLGDLIASGLVEVKYLTHVYRQEEGSLIVSNAHLINQCKMPIADNTSKDFFITYKDNQVDILNTVVDMASRRLPGFAKVDAKSIQVLCPLKGGVSGVNNLNVQLQAILNPPGRNKNEVRYGNTTYREGDKVMQVRNNYEQTWSRTTETGYEESTGVFNGDLGIITQINTSTNTLVVTFDDGRQALYLANDLEDVRLAYAVTVHKSQGSEFDVVIIAVTNGPPTILNKNLLYTAVTRAKKMVVMVCSKKTLSLMVHNNYVKQRTTMLKKFLIEENKKYDTFFG